MRRVLIGLAAVLVALAGASPADAGPPPPTPLTGVASVRTATSGLTTCARLANTQVRCWGSGYLGRGSIEQHQTPVVVENASGTGPLRGVVDVRSGTGFTCALLQSGQVRCWGADTHGELGTGTGQNRLRPAVVLNPAGTRPLLDVTRISAGWNHMCARKGGGTVVCWGQNNYRQLGTRTRVDRLLPVVVRHPDGTPLTQATDVAAGANHTCAIVGAARRAVCWGHNRVGQLGDGTRVGSLGAVPVRPGAPLSGVFDLTAGATHTCAAMLDGRLRCWGDNRKGQLGDGSTTTADLPVPIGNEDGTGPLTDVTQLSAGNSYTCARLQAGEVRCWGWGDQGQLGDGTFSDRLRPVPVVVAFGGDALPGVTQVAAGYNATCATLIGGEVRCWGANLAGQLGDGSTTPSNVPVTVVS